MKPACFPLTSQGKYGERGRGRVGGEEALHLQACGTMQQDADSTGFVGVRTVEEGVK